MREAGTREAGTRDSTPIGKTLPHSNWISSQEKTTIVEIFNPTGFGQIQLSAVQAVIYMPPELPGWFEELGQAVRSGAFHLARMATDYLPPRKIEAWLASILPEREISPQTREGLMQDLLSLVGICQDITGAGSFQLRIMTAKPDRVHGFHVDICKTPPTRRILRVYGDGTRYVEPANITRMSDFYAYVNRREILARNLTPYLQATPPPGSSVSYRQLVELDKRPPFIRNPEELKQVPVGSIVAIENVPAGFLRPLDILRGRANGWVHRSPFEGEARLVVLVENEND